MTIRQVPSTNSLQRLDKELSMLRRAFSEIARDVSFEYIDSLTSEAAIHRQNYQGVYLIELHTSDTHQDLDSWFEAFHAHWDHPRFKDKFTPSTKKKRIAAHKSLLEWMPLYIGKSKKIGARIWEHINLDLDAKTFALKLRQRPELELGKLRLSTINFAKLGIENYDLIAPALEQAMRDRLNPLVGKQ